VPSHRAVTTTAVQLATKTVSRGTGAIKAMGAMGGLQGLAKLGQGVAAEVAAMAMDGGPRRASTDLSLAAEAAAQKERGEWDEEEEGSAEGGEDRFAKGGELDRSSGSRPGTRGSYTGAPSELSAERSGSRPRLSVAQGQRKQLNASESRNRGHRLTRAAGASAADLNFAVQQKQQRMSFAQDMVDHDAGRRDSVYSRKGSSASVFDGPSGPARAAPPRRPESETKVRALRRQRLLPAACCLLPAACCCCRSPERCNHSPTPTAPPPHSSAHLSPPPSAPLTACCWSSP
jgi:hypothetical protein